MEIFERALKKAPLAAEKMAGKSAAQVKRWRSEVAAFDAASAFQLRWKAPSAIRSPSPPGRRTSPRPVSFGK
jgi:hypothetical protein